MLFVKATDPHLGSRLSSAVRWLWELRYSLSLSLQAALSGREATK